MTLGVCMKGFNAVYHKSSLDFFFEFIPQLVFLLCLFGTMDVLIISKWVTDWSGREGQAPAIITQMINNCLKGGEVNGAPLLGENQPLIVKVLLLTCLICVPLMLYVKPVVLNKR